MPWYFTASLSPALLIGAACLWGGAWAFAALASVSVFVFCADRWTRGGPGLREDAATARLARILYWTLAGAHLVLLPLGVWRLAQGADGWAVSLALFFALGLYFGQVSNSNAHEMIHAAWRPARRMGALVYVTLLFGHHASAHPRVHHIHVATDADPNSARRGESFYRFWPRAWAGSFREGFRAETRRGLPAWRHPYAWYVGGALLCIAAAWALAGVRGLIAYLALAFYAQTQLILVDYVQHYGLRREIGADGRPARQGPQHSWNAAPWYSAAMMLNAPHHSDHHLNASRPFPALRLAPERMPVLPHSLPVMGAIALVPPVWRRVMHRRLKRLADAA